MPRRLAAVLAVAFIAFGVVLPAAAQSRSVLWQEWDVRINSIDTTDNQFDVTEFYALDFTGTFRFGTLYIPFNNLEDIQIIHIWNDGHLLVENCSESPGTYCTTVSDDGLSMTYYFAQPVTDNTTNVMIEYTVVGALRVYDEGDQLWWTAIPANHYGIRIELSAVTVEMPQGFAPREGIDPVTTYGVPTTISVDGTKITAKANAPLKGDDYLEIRVQYPHDPNARVADWQTAFDEAQMSETSVDPLAGFTVIARPILWLIMHVITGR